MKAVNILSRVSAGAILAVLIGMTVLTIYTVSSSKPFGDQISAYYWLYHDDRQLLLQLEREHSAVQSLLLQPNLAITNRFAAANTDFTRVLLEELSIEPPSDKSLTASIWAKHQTYVNVARSIVRSVQKGDLPKAHSLLKPLLQQRDDLVTIIGRNSAFRLRRADSFIGYYFGLTAYAQIAFAAGGVLAVLILGGLLYTVEIYKRRADRAIRAQMEQLEIAALTDQLTQLGNQRAFYKDLPVETSRSRRYDRPLTLALIDIDEFKKINDTQGHHYGDFIISSLGQALKKMRVHDHGYRIGGDEMAVILPETDAAQALEALERLSEDSRRALFGATISIGFAQLREDELIQNLYERADAALYEAKHRGRNTIVNFNDIPGTDPTPGEHTSAVA